MAGCKSKQQKHAYPRDEGDVTVSFGAWDSTGDKVGMIQPRIEVLPCFPFRGDYAKSSWYKKNAAEEVFEQQASASGHIYECHRHIPAFT